MRYFLLILLLSFSFLVKAQETHVQKMMNHGKELLKKEKFEDAEKAFRKVFNSKETLPDELCFYYGYSLFKIGKLVKAREFLEKYQTLTQKKGEFSPESVVILDDIERNVCGICKGTGYYTDDDTCQTCSGTGTTLDDCHACHGSNKLVCPTCKGQKVITVNNSLGTWYNDCPQCEDGTVTCMRCKGLKKEETTCHQCKGRGKIRVKKVCNHTH